MTTTCPPPSDYYIVDSDVVTTSYGRDEISPSGQGSTLVCVPPTAYRGGSAATLHTLDALFARIDALTQLIDNWDSYGGTAPNTEAALLAKRVARLADWIGLLPTAIVSSAEDGIGIAFRRGGRYADIEVLNSGEVLAVTSDGTGAPRVWQVDPSDVGITDALKVIRDYLW